MNNDRELLELAAKAAGIEYGADRIDSGLSLTEKDGRHRSLPRWNPLEDDGDALRLAVKLAIDLYFHETDIEATALQADPDENGVYPFSIETAGRDGYAATRRAIVRVAASIGRGMK